MITITIICIKFINRIIITAITSLPKPHYHYITLPLPYYDLEYVNMSVDGWADNTNRCFNGYIAKSIDRNWFAYRKSYITAKHIHIYFHNLKLINKHIW